ncbi:MAG: hypothetical protein KAI17_03365 [Thiotrichaceae bacterium]|nr:hypothetical protein [Thiotrichaceae bacterium]
MNPNAKIESAFLSLEYIQRTVNEEVALTKDRFISLKSTIEKLQKEIRELKREKR